MGPAARGLGFMSLVKLPTRHCVVYCLHIVKSTRTALNYEEASGGLDYVGSHQTGDISEEVRPSRLCGLWSRRSPPVLGYRVAFSGGRSPIRQFNSIRLI